ncbi:MAG: hypothetical protein HY318_15320 [Armatimonadetes bacterium]|nr:hypothetical protein [Armatimonadota bacterium]
MKTPITRGVGKRRRLRENKGIHVMFAGRKGMLELPPVNRAFKPEEVPPENLTCSPASADGNWHQVVCLKQ